MENHTTYETHPWQVRREWNNEDSLDSLRLRYYYNYYDKLLRTLSPSKVYMYSTCTVLVVPCASLLPQQLMCEPHDFILSHVVYTHRRRRNWKKQGRDIRKILVSSFCFILFTSLKYMIIACNNDDEPHKNNK